MDRPDCMQWSGRPSGHSWTADEEGAIVGGGQGPLAIQGIDISFYAHTVNALGSPAIFDLSLKHQDGIRVYRLLRELRADIFANTPEVRGEASAGDVVSLSLRGPQGQVRADALAVADSDGLWAAHWRDDAGQDIRPDVGDRVVVESGPSSAEIEVLPLGFDRIGDRLVGTAPPGSTVWLRYTLSPSLFGGEALGDEPHVTTVLVDTDETGRFEIPLKSEGQGWTEEDLVSIRASLRLEGRHEIVEEWFRPPDLGEAPTRSYLPWTSVRR